MNGIDTPDRAASLGVLAGTYWLDSPLRDEHSCTWCDQLLHPTRSDLRTPTTNNTGSPSPAQLLAALRAAVLTLAVVATIAALART